MTLPKPQLLGVLAVLLASGTALGQDVPLKNWTVPPYRTHSSSGDTIPVTDVTGPRLFIGVQPCRVADTRGNAAPIQGGIFGNSEARNWTVWGICGIPPGADAISVNFSVVSAPATPQGGFLLAWPTGSPPAPASITAIMTYGPGVTVLSNAAIVPLSAGSLTVNVSHSTHVIMDVNGYFSDTLGNQANSLLLFNNSPGGATASFSNAASANMSTGVLGLAGPAFPRPGNYRASGLRGEGTLTGVLGVSQLQGAAGSLVDGAGGEKAFGILGYWFAGTADFANTAGVYGQNYSPYGASAGVYGADNGGFAGTAGVRGVSVNGIGVLGRSRYQGVVGQNLDNLDALKTTGYLGFNDTVGVHSIGTITATAMKSFVEPHPTDPTKEIVYVALEGREAGTYFRGKGRLQRGMAVIEIPDDFRMVTDTEGLSIQVTPIGEMATVAVVSLGLDRIVVKGSRNVEFFYTVNGVRKAFRDHAPIAENTHYVPEGPEARMPGAYAPEQRRRLIATGIYNEDGTVNVDTARRLGWNKVWEQRSRPAPQPGEP